MLEKLTTVEKMELGAALYRAAGNLNGEGAALLRSPAAALEAYGLNGCGPYQFLAAAAEAASLASEAVTSGLDSIAANPPIAGATR